MVSTVFLCSKCQSVHIQSETWRGEVQNTFRKNVFLCPQNSGEIVDWRGERKFERWMVCFIWACWLVCLSGLYTWMSSWFEGLFFVRWELFHIKNDIAFWGFREDRTVNTRMGAQSKLKHLLWNKGGYLKVVGGDVLNKCAFFWKRKHKTIRFFVRRYIIQKRLGWGHFSMVWLAIDKTKAQDEPDHFPFFF